MIVHDARAERGRELFLSNEASCNTCHFNAGANFSLIHGNPGANIFQHSDVDLERFRLTDLTGVFIPEDEGFIFPGQNPAAMNGQPVVDSVPKEAFFHKHIILDDSGEEIEQGGGIEGAITFYFREPFTTSEIHGALQGLLGGAGGGDGSLNVHIDTLEDFKAFGGEDAIEVMGAFLRSLSAFYKIRDCERLVQETIDRIMNEIAHDLPALHCRFNLKDGKKVLKEARVEKPKLYKDVADALSNLKKDLKEATKDRDIEALELVLEKLVEQREVI